MSAIRFALCAAAAAACAAPSALAQPAFSQIWTFVGSEPIGLGDDGRAVFRQPFQGPTFRWSYNGGATAINNVVLNPYTTSPDGLTLIGGAPQLQYARGPVTNVTASGPSNFHATGMSADAGIIAGTSAFDGGGYVYTPGSGFVRVQLPGALPGGGTALAATATAMSRSGNHVAGMFYGASGPMLYRLDRTTGTATTFSAPPFPGPNETAVRAMSDDGQILYISADTTAGNPASHRWTEASGYQTLPTLTLTPAQQLLYPHANGVHYVTDTTADGSIAVGNIGSGPSFIWDEAGGIRDLATELTTRYHLTLPAGMIFTGATSISADGLWLMGSCDLPIPGAITSSTWIAYIPTPGAAVLLGLGSAAAVHRRRR